MISLYGFEIHQDTYEQLHEFTFEFNDFLIKKLIRIMRNREMREHYYDCKEVMRAHHYDSKEVMKDHYYFKEVMKKKNLYQSLNYPVIKLRYWFMTIYSF